MTTKRLLLGWPVLLLLLLLAVAAVLGAGPQLKWWLPGSGGGPAQGIGYGLASAIGQPASGQVSNGYTIYSGLYLGVTAPGPGLSKVLLPVTVYEACFGLPASMETEPNDISAQADGPLCPGVVYSGNPDYHGKAIDDDWFSFYWSGTGSITIDLKNFLSKGQLLLYYDPTTGSLLRAWDQPDGHYTIKYNGTGKAGRYYIRVFAPDGHPTGHGNYTLIYQ